MARHQPVSGERLEYELDASRLGMWVFLATEVLFFGALMATFSVYRFLNFHAFSEAARHTDLILGSINTGVLLTSSLSMAISVHLAKEGRFKAAALALLITGLLGAGFLSIKGLEWAKEIREGLWPGPGFDFPIAADAAGARLFFCMYFCMTGLHAFHMIFGLIAVAIIATLCAAGKLDKDDTAVVENLGLYWHFVDIVWIWLYPLLYLLGRSGR